LSQQAGFENIPAFVGAVEWKFEKESMVLGMVQEMVESSSDAWTYMLDRLDDFNENILSKTEISQPTKPLQGTLIDPLPYESIPEEMKELLEASVAERIYLLGVRTGEMHLKLELGTSPDFKPEPYSLHYQRSLFAGLQ